MTEYWKSTGKKFCGICKAWYADNKISIERHEQGLKHKGMVQQSLRESSKKAREKEMEAQKLQLTLIGMEQAATASVAKEEASRKRGQGSYALAPPQPLISQEKYEEILAKKRKAEEESLESFIKLRTGGLIAPGNYEQPKIAYHESKSKTIEDLKPPLLSKAERKKIKRERAAEAAVEPVKVPDDLVEIKYEQEKSPQWELQPQIQPNQGQSLLGPWVPITNAVTVIEDDIHKKAKVIYNDLPEQSYGPASSSTPAELLEIAEMDPEDFSFKDKIIQSSRKLKVIEFRKRNVKTNNLRRRINE